MFICSLPSWRKEHFGRGRAEKRLPPRRRLQYSSQVVETDTVSLEFSRKFLRFTPCTFFFTVMCPLSPQCWTTRILKHWDHCNTEINIGEGETHTSVSRFLTRIVVYLSFVKPLKWAKLMKGRTTYLGILTRIHLFQRSVKVTGYSAVTFPKVESKF